MTYFKHVCVLAVFYVIAQFDLILAETSCRNRVTVSMHGTCQVIDSCTGAALIIQDVCENGLVCCVDDPGISVGLNETDRVLVDLNGYLDVFGNTTRTRAFYTAFVKSLHGSGVTIRHGAIKYAKQINGETKGLRYFEEDCGECSKYDFDKKLGNNATGAGFKYKGRGGLYVRGKTNYINIATLIRNEFGYDILAEPEHVAYPTVGFRVASIIWKEQEKNRKNFGLTYNQIILIYFAIICIFSISMYIFTCY